MSAWYLLTMDKNGVTRGLAENSPRRSLLMVLTHGLLSVRIQAYKWGDVIRTKVLHASSDA
jgi:hypothetical protein